MESQEELSKLRESELTIAAYADFILSDELSVKARIKKVCVMLVFSCFFDTY